MATICALPSIHTIPTCRAAFYYSVNKGQSIYITLCNRRSEGAHRHRGVGNKLPWFATALGSIQLYLTIVIWQRISCENWDLNSKPENCDAPFIIIKIWCSNLIISRSCELILFIIHIIYIRQMWLGDDVIHMTGLYTYNCMGWVVLLPHRPRVRGSILNLSYCLFWISHGALWQAGTLFRMNSHTLHPVWLGKAMNPPQPWPNSSWSCMNEWD